MITDEERLNLQLLYKPFCVMLDLTDVQELFQDRGRRTQRAFLDQLLTTLTPSQWVFFKGYMEETFSQMLVVEEASFYEGVNKAVEYLNKKEP